ncbi:MAG: hypothetical protein IKR92_03215, partial [Alphaproteobacteria bacterium]|nr:hypothetical protein [Alphaproteobacteria bacterium]
MTRPTDEDGYPIIDTYDETLAHNKKLRKIWHKLTVNPVVNALRESQLNPFRTSLPVNDSVKEIIARDQERAKGVFEYVHRPKGSRRGVRRYTELDCSVDEEAKTYGSVSRGGHDVLEWLPKNEKGEYDLFAEEPIVIAVVPIDGPSLVGHVCMQYKDHIVNRRNDYMDTGPLFQAYGK